MPPASVTVRAPAAVIPSWLITLATCPSTNTYLLERSQHLPIGSAVWTRRQTAGRGRLGAAWQSPSGVLTVSFLFESRIARGSLALAAGLAVIHAIDDVVPGLPLRLAWPNDVVLGEGKLAGLLCETRGDRVVIGIGLNIDPAWHQVGLDPRRLPGAKRPATSLAEHGAVQRGAIDPNRPLSLIRALRHYLGQASALVADGRYAALHDDLTRRDALFGRRLRITTSDLIHEGDGAGIDSDGRLLLARANRPPLSFVSGRIEVLDLATDAHPGPHP